MAISVDWVNRVITVPRNDMTLLQSSPSEVRELDLNSFRLELKTLEDSEGIPFDDTHRHVSPITISGLTLARVVEIINGYSVTFENGQYIVNLVGANSNVGDSINSNQVSIRTFNSAGLSFPEQITTQSFQGRISIDTVNGSAGTAFPLGTPSAPVDNFSDALILSQQQNIKTLNIRGTITPNTSLDDLIVQSDTRMVSEIILTGVSTDRTLFKDVTVSGDVQGIASFNRAKVNTLNQFKGEMYDTAITGPITLSTACSGIIRMIDCYSDVPGTSRPVVDANNTTCDISIRGYTGGIVLENITSGNNVSIDMDSGYVEIAPTCTNGTIVVRGVCQLENNADGATVITDGLIENLAASGSVTPQDKRDIAELVIPHIWASS